MRKKEWSLLDTFEESDSMLAVVREKTGTVRQKRTVDGKTGVSVYYLCKHARKFSCPYQMYHFKPEVAGGRFELYEVGEHCCDTAEYKSGLTRKQREAVDLAMKMRQGLGRPTQLIRAMLNAQGNEVPNTKQLKNAVSKAKRKFSGPPVLTTTDFGELIEADFTTLTPDTDLHEVVCPVSDSSSPERLFAFFTTRYLLSNLSKMGATTLQTDGTYKLTYEGNILITLAVSDKARRLHPVGVAIIGKTENAAVYERAFEAIATALQKAGLPAFEPDAVMSDGDPCITAAVASTFPNARRLTCYYHMKKQVQKRMGSKKVPKDRRQTILEEIRSLQLACSDAVFNSAARRLLQRWKQLGLRAFATYFKRVWVKGPLRYWYEGAAMGEVSTNNGLESLHGRIKRFGTLRKKMPIGSFVKEMNRLMEEWSRASETHTFQSVPPRTLSLEVKGFHWSEDPVNKDFVAPQLRTGTYFVPGSFANEMSYRNYGRCDLRGRFRTFGHFVIWSKAYYRVFRNSANLLLCTCAFSAKMFICKHSIAIERMKFDIDVSLKAKALPIDYRPGRGRPKSVGPALSMD
uniref:SWIM-type domain-containing protein n=1 Tax=Plectus sambesii TaxID=2011161 RepID=A0A914X3P3_9BILA